MEIKIDNKDFFVRYFLQPISKVSDNCVIVVDKEGFSCVVNTADNAIILNNNYKVPQNFETKISLNVPDIKKLVRAFEVIDGESVSLNFDKNNINYKNNSISFKYHLLENGVINKPKINLEKINSIQIDSKFDITETALSEIIKASTFCVDSNKIYFTAAEGKVFAELTDRSKPNVDSFGIQVAETFEGKDIKSICLNVEILRILSTNKVKQIHCKTNNSLGVVLFDYGNKVVYTQFIVSSLTK
jgi:hypothetical protein